MLVDHLDPVAFTAQSLHANMHRLQVLANQLGPEVREESNATKASEHGHNACLTQYCTAIICGGVVLDIQAQSNTHTLQRGGSVPGQVRQVPGGVARNIADAASQLLKQSVPPPLLISAVGQDAAGSVLTTNLQSFRLDLSVLQQVAGMRTATVVAVMDSGGEVASCVADVTDIEQTMTPSRIAEVLPSALARARLLVLETNLSEASISRACQLAAASGVPILLEPVSGPKATRCVSSLKHLTWLTPNVNELIAIADEVCRRNGWQLLPRPTDRLSSNVVQSASCMQQPLVNGTSGGSPTLPSALLSLLPFAKLVLEQGVKKIVLTLGAEGAALITLARNDHDILQYEGRGPMPAVAAMHSTKTGPGSTSCVQVVSGKPACKLHIVHLPALSAKVVSLSGAGDTLVGGLVASLLNMPEQDDVAAVAVGMAAATKTVESTKNVYDKLGMNELLTLSKHILQNASSYIVSFA